MQHHYLRTSLTVDVNLVCWDAELVNGRRPQIAAKIGTRVRVRVEYRSDGTMYTAFVRRRGRLWSNTRLAKRDGSTVKGYCCPYGHSKVLQEQYKELPAGVL